MSRLPALLPQDPHQRRCASSTHIRDRTHGMVREASSCETIGTVMGSGRGSHRRSTQGQAVHESKRPKTTSRRQRRHLGRQRPGRHGTGATIRQINPNSYTSIRSYSQSRHDPSRSFEMEQNAHPPANVRGQQAISRNRTAKASPYGKRTASLSEASTCWSNSTPTWIPTTMTTRPELRHSTA